MAKRAEKTTGGTGGKIVETVTKTREVVDESGGELALEATGAEGEQDALGVLEELAGDGAKFIIHRTSPTGYDGYVGTYTADELSPDRLSEEWGGGRYRISLRNSEGHFVRSAILVVAGKPKHKADPAQPAPSVVQAAAPATPPVDTAGIVSAVTNSMKPTIDMLSRLVEALITRPAPVAEKGPDILTVLEKAKTIFGKSGGEDGGMKTLLQGIELGQKLAGEGGGGESNMADVFLEGFKTIKTAAAAAATRRPAPAARIAAPQAAAAPPGVTASPVQAPPATDEEKQGQWLKAQIAFLLKQARAGKNASLYAELFADQLPPYLPPETVLQHLQDDGAVENLSLLVPEVAQHATWFEEFRKEALKFLGGATDEGGGGAVIDAGGDIPGGDADHGGGGDGF